MLMRILLMSVILVYDFLIFDNDKSLAFFQDFLTLNELNHTYIEI